LKSGKSCTTLIKSYAGVKGQQNLTVTRCRLSVFISDVMRTRNVLLIVNVTVTLDLSTAYRRMYRISAPANPKSGPSPAPVKFLAEFAGCDCSCSMFSFTDKSNAADLSSGVFAVLISVTLTITIQNLLPFHRFRQKLANSDITKETPNCTDSL